MGHSDIKKQHPYIESELRRLERSYPLLMSFDKDLEIPFQRHYVHRYLLHVRIALVLGFLSILATGTIELFGAAFSSSLYAWFLRVIATVVLGVGWWYSMNARIKMQRVIFWGSLMLCIVALEFARINEPPYKHLYYSALLYVQIFAFALSRLQLKWAIPCSSVIFVAGNIYIWFFDSLITKDRFIILFILTAGCAVSITVCYLLERAVRISYLQRKLLGLENAFLQENNIQLRDELLIDSLTHITNRRGFDNAIAQEWDRALRNHYPLALILFDVDYFKQFNDSYGHQAGDACLTGIAAVPKSMIGRAGDSVARYGGEEFIVTLIGTSLEDARLFAEDMCERVMELSIPHKSSQVADVVTISCGVAAIVPDQATRYEDLIKLADNALYESKRNGRNRVTCASPSPKKDNINKKTA